MSKAIHKTLLALEAEVNIHLGRVGEIDLSKEPQLYQGALDLVRNSQLRALEAKTNKRIGPLGKIDLAAEPKLYDGALDLVRRSRLRAMAGTKREKSDLAAATVRQQARSLFIGIAASLLVCLLAYTVWRQTSRNREETRRNTLQTLDNQYDPLKLTAAEKVARPRILQDNSRSSARSGKAQGDVSALPVVSGADASIGRVKISGSNLGRTTTDVTTSTNSAPLALGSGANASVGGISIQGSNVSGTLTDTTVTNSAALALGLGDNASIGGINISGSNVSEPATPLTIAPNSAALVIGSRMGADVGGIRTDTAKNTNTPIVRPIDATLERFGQMISAYKLPEGPITIEIDYLENSAGSGKAPNDVGDIARDALAKTGMFQTLRTLPATAASKDPTGVVLSQLLRDRGNTPKPTFRLVGGIEEAEQITLEQKNERGDMEFGGGHTTSDGGLTADRSRKRTALTIGLTLERPTDSVAVVGASARYSTYIDQTESNNGIEFYVGGSGFGLGSRLKVTQQSGDALYDTIAVTLIEILGKALRIPYYRCDGQRFRPDAWLENRVQHDFSALTNMQLEQELRRFMLVEGFNIGRQLGPLEPADRAVLIVEMEHRKLPVTREGMLTLAMQFWRNLDYSEGAQRMAAIYPQK